MKTFNNLPEALQVTLQFCGIIFFTFSFVEIMEYSFPNPVDITEKMFETSDCFEDISLACDQANEPVFLFSEACAEVDEVAVLETAVTLVMSTEVEKSAKRILHTVSKKKKQELSSKASSTKSSTAYLDTDYQSRINTFNNSPKREKDGMFMNQDGTVTIHKGKDNIKALAKKNAIAETLSKHSVAKSAKPENNRAVVEMVAESVAAIKESRLYHSSNITFETARNMITLKVRPGASEHTCVSKTKGWLKRKKINLLGVCLACERASKIEVAYDLGAIELDEPIYAIYYRNDVPIDTFSVAGRYGVFVVNSPYVSRFSTKAVMGPGGIPCTPIMRAHVSFVRLNPSKRQRSRPIVLKSVPIPIPVGHTTALTGELKTINLFSHYLSGR